MATSSLSVTSWAMVDRFRPRLIVSSKVFQAVFRLFVLQFSITFGILLLFILVTCSQFDLYRISFLPTGSIFNFSKNSSPLLWSKLAYLSAYWKFSSRLMPIVFYPFFYESKLRFHIEEWGDRIHYILLFLKWITLVQRIKGDNLTTGLPSGRLVNPPTELSITFNPQFTHGMVLNEAYGQIYDYLYPIKMNRS